MNNEQVDIPESVTGSGKFYYPDGATYEGEWLLIPEPASTEDEAGAADETPADEANAQAADPEESAATGEEASDEKDAAAEKGDEPPAEPKGTYFRHGRGKYVEGDYSYDGEWENVRFAPCEHNDYLTSSTEKQKALA